MKKLFKLVIALVTVLSLALFVSCGDDGPENEKDDGSIDLPFVDYVP